MLPSVFYLFQTLSECHNKKSTNIKDSPQSFPHFCNCHFLILHFTHVRAGEASRGVFSMGINHNEKLLRSCSKDERSRIKDV